MRPRAALRQFTSGLRRRAAFGLHPVTAPVMIFIPLGLLAGPAGAAILSENALAHLDVVVTLGLATLGVFIGVAVGREGLKAKRLFAASSVEAAVTIAVVAAVVYVLVGLWQLPIEVPAAVGALALGICASASSAPAVEGFPDHASAIAARVADLDDVVPIVLGGLVLGLALPAGPGPVASAALAIFIGLTVGVAGWLLFERASGRAERGVFVLGSLGLLGGSAAYAGASPLLAGMTAGWLWVVAPGRADRLMADDLRKVQHPLVVLLLITAGASMQPSLVGIWLFAPYVVFRLAGKITGGWIASRIAPGIAPSDLGGYLIPPGVIGIAFALNIAQIAPGAAGAIVFAVALGAVACELLAIVLTPASHVS